MLSKSIGLIVACLFCQGAMAASWIVATNGTAGGAGSLASPFDLQTALNKVGVILPGDFIYLRTGNYTHIPQQTNCAACDDPGFVFRGILTGTAANPIWIESYPGDWAKIDGGDWPHYFANGRPTLKLGVGVGSTQGDYLCVRNLELYSSSTESRHSQFNVSDPTDINRSDGFYAVAKGNKIVNCIIHDVTAGISSFTDAGMGHEFYGNVIYNCGWQGTPNVHGHGFYCQGPINTSGLVKTIKRNVIGCTYAHGGQIYGSGTGGGAQVSHFRISENAWLGTPGHGGLLIGAKNGGTTPDRLQDNQIFDNFGYGASLALYYETYYFAYKDLRVTGNYLVNSKVTCSSWETLTLTNNTLIDPVGITFGNVSIQTVPANASGLLPWNWDRNNYVFTTPTYQGFNWDGVANYNLTQWRAATGYDLNSTVVSAVPTVNYITLQNNIYNTNRAHVIIYNWANSSSIAINVASLNWGAGANVLVHNAQNYFADAVNLPVSAGGTLTVNMLASAHTVALPYGDTAPIDPKTFPQFGVFILERTGQTTEVPPNNWTATIGSVNPSSGVVVTVTPSDLNGASSGTTPFTRLYVDATVTSITAPATSGANTFTNWTRNGVLYSTTRATTFTNTADTTFTANYASPPPNFEVAIHSVNPSSGTTITVTPNDNGGLGNGVTPFFRTNVQNSVTTLTAPVLATAFIRWERNGVAYGSGAASVAFTNTVSGVTFTAVYTAPTPPSTNYTVTVTSSNPNSGIVITNTPVDNGGLGNGTTTFLRTNIQDRVTTLTAPALESGNNFTRWDRNGTFYSSTRATTFTNVGNVTFSAVYTTPPVTNVVVTINSLNPSTGIVILHTPNDVNGQGAGTATFTRTNVLGAVIQLEAPEGAQALLRWERDGVLYAGPSTFVIFFTNTADVTFTVVYDPTPGPPSFIAAFNSYNPQPVKITISPADNGGFASGDTPFTRTNTQGVVTSISAENPALLNGNAFLRWELDGVLYSTNAATTFTNVAPATFVAIYTNANFLATINSTGGSDCLIDVSEPDVTGASFGITPFTRLWPRDAVITLTSALADKNGSPMTGWLFDGSPYTSTTDATFTNNAAHTLTAVYTAPPPPPAAPGGTAGYASRRRGMGM